MFDFFNLPYNVVDPDGDVEYRSTPFPFLSTHAHCARGTACCGHLPRNLGILNMRAEVTIRSCRGGK